MVPASPARIYKMIDCTFEFSSDVEHIANALLADVEVGPFYLASPANSEDVLSLPDRSVFLAGWGTADGPGFYGSEQWQVARDIISDAIDNHARFYDADSGSWSDSEPEPWQEDCYECDGTDPDCEDCEGTGKVWREPEPYYELERSDIARGLLGRAYSDIL